MGRNARRRIGARAGLRVRAAVSARCLIRAPGAPSSIGWQVLLVRTDDFAHVAAIDRNERSILRVELGVTASLADRSRELAGRLGLVAEPALTGERDGDVERPELRRELAGVCDAFDQQDVVVPALRADVTLPHAA